MLPIHWMDRGALLSLVTQGLKLLGQPPFWTLLERTENSGEYPPGKLWPKHTMLPLTRHWLELGTWVHLTTGWSESRENWKYLANNSSHCHSWIEKVLNHSAVHRKLMLHCMLANWNLNKNLNESVERAVLARAEITSAETEKQCEQCWDTVLAIPWLFILLPQTIFQFNSLQLS